MDKRKIIIHNKTKDTKIRLIMPIIQKLLYYLDLKALIIHVNFGERQKVEGDWDLSVDIYISQNNLSLTFWIYDSKE